MTKPDNEGEAWVKLSQESLAMWASENPYDETECSNVWHKRRCPDCDEAHVDVLTRAKCDDRVAKEYSDGWNDHQVATEGMVEDAIEQSARQAYEYGETIQSHSKGDCFCIPCNIEAAILHQMEK